MKRNDKPGIVLGVLAILCALFICGLPVKLGRLELGWVFGFALGLAGLLRSRRKKGTFNTKIGLILSIVGIAVSVANLIAGIVMQ